MRFSGMLYILPWIFIYVPELLILDSQPLNVTFVIIACLLATLTTSFVLGVDVGQLSTAQRFSMATTSFCFWMATFYLSAKGPLVQVLGYRPEWAIVLIGVGMLIWVRVIISKMSHKKVKTMNVSIK